MRATEPIASGHSFLSKRHYAVNILMYKHHNIHTVPFYNDTITTPDINSGSPWNLAEQRSTTLPPVPVLPSTHVMIFISI